MKVHTLKTLLATTIIAYGAVICKDAISTYLSLPCSTDADCLIYDAYIPTKEWCTTLQYTETGMRCYYNDTMVYGSHVYLRNGKCPESNCLEGETTSEEPYIFFQPFLYRAPDCR